MGLASSINIVEIWDKESFEQVVDDAEVDFATLTEEVMGNIDIDELS